MKNQTNGGSRSKRRNFVEISTSRFKKIKQSNLTSSERIDHFCDLSWWSVSSSLPKAIWVLENIRFLPIFWKVCHQISMPHRSKIYECKCYWKSISSKLGYHTTAIVQKSHIESMTNSRTADVWAQYLSVYLPNILPNRELGRRQGRENTISIENYCSINVRLWMQKIHKK